MSTEDVARRYRDLDTWPAREVLEALLERNFSALAAVREALGPIEAAALAAAERLRDPEGRLVYAGAGTSGRLAVLDAVELPPTFGWPPERLVHLLAGGDAALTRSAEAAEDDEEAGEQGVRTLRLGARDVFVAVAASGRTPSTVAATRAARAGGALTVGLANNPETPLLHAAEHAILLDTGAEVVAGSTRLAAGTAQKVALNLFSTLLMVRLGRVYSNLMVGVQASNAKLSERAARIVAQLTGVDPARARALLQQAGGDVRLALLLLQGFELAEARARLEAAGGRLREVLE
ncbi:MAG TPA: N-acetylmuramic acid 6-phosphate etherase [Oceanithermus profundus]|uniref:N-acetylmuramic acid 6-phosphate etherase n=2 Tax=Oceanithermus profundus TaxID=187137 RepID=A0A7C4Z6M8_9DEIN|nr:N-acetylmuramic acid 6-phosphate etherase [Oceanithermus profundus]